jgi:hypothetical protein
MRAYPIPYRRFAIAVMMTLLWTLVTVGQAPTVIRIGEVARELTNTDVADLVQTMPAGSKPWLLIGERGQSPTGQTIEAYLPPVTSTPEVRRGSMIPLRRFVRNTAAPEPWTVITNYQRGGATPISYAQVLLAGRSFDQIQGDDDTNRPFILKGNPKDNDLVEVVSVLRASRLNRYPGGGYISGLPILNMDWQTNYFVVVDLRDGGILKQQRATLKKEGAVWVITQVVTGQA